MTINTSDRKDFSSVVGNRIRTLRIQNGLTMADLGNHIGITSQQMSKYELGANKISAEFLYDIAQLLGIEVSFFYAGHEGNTSTPKTGKLSIIDAYNRIPNQRIKKDILKLIQSLNDN